MIKIQHLLNKIQLKNQSNYLKWRKCKMKPQTQMNQKQLIIGFLYLTKYFRPEKSGIKENNIRKNLYLCAIMTLKHMNYFKFK